MMKPFSLRRVSLALAALAAILVAPALAAAQSVLRDSETEALFADLMAPLSTAAGLPAGNVDVVLISDRSINAFVAGGQRIYVHAGLIEAADNVNQLQGVLAHELGHVMGGHIIRSGDGQKEATGIAILGTLLGAAAFAAGSGDAGMGLMMMSQRAALGSYLAFSRGEESSADAAGAAYLSGAGISGKGSLAFFRKLENQELRLAIPQRDSYERTHPLSRERIQSLSGIYQQDPAWDAPIDPALEERFQRIKAKLTGYLDPKQTLSLYPASDQSVTAHYARAYAYHRSQYPERTAREIDALLKAEPDNPYFLEMRGQTLLENGRVDEAIPALRKAAAIAPEAPMIQVLLGHALLSSEQPENYAEAKSVIKAAVNRDNDDPFAWHVLGMIHAREGNQAMAALAGAEEQRLRGDDRRALDLARTAMAGLPKGSPDWIRAQDIAMVVRADLEDDKKKKKKRD